MVSLQPYLTKLLKSLPPPPANQDVLTEAVKKTLADAEHKSSLETRKHQWEYLLKDEIFNLVATEGKALESGTTTYYDQLRDKLDLVLIFTEHDACEQTFPFIVLQDLLETQTITSCSHIFSWIEDRAARLTDGMVPQKGKALILLRTLNDLLRRLSKMGPTTIFCGRILTFLSGVFPLGERSGVNLRGEYGPTWEGVKYSDKIKGEDKDIDMSAELAPHGAEDSQPDKMQMDVKEVSSAQPLLTATQKQEDFYNTFWSLQHYFSKPPLFAVKTTFEEFKEAVNNVMPVIKEATAKERAMMGSRGLGGIASSLKRKREPENEESNTNEYFFAKFLTSPDLLDLEIADTHFRRQFLFQLLILLHHLLTFTKMAKENWSSIRNRSLQMDFTLESTDVQWVQESVTKVVEELRQTTPNGRQFADTAGVILEREKNWVRWKNELCAPFDKEPWSIELEGERVGMSDATKAARLEMRKPPTSWKWLLGTEPLTEIWEMGYRDLYDLQQPFQPGDVKDFLKKIKQDDARIELRKKQLAMAAERVAQTQARAAAAARASIVTPDLGNKASSLVKPESSQSSPDSSGLSAPKPVLATANSPLHPSLPPKPGSPVKQSSAQEALAVPIPTAPAIATPSPAPTPAPAPPTVPTPALPPALTDEQITKLEENKQRVAWLALRTARDQYLQHFGKIGTGDIELLAQEIETEKKLEREKTQKGEDGINSDQGSESQIGVDTSDSSRGAEDVKMEG